MIDWSLVAFLGGVAGILMFLALWYLVSNKKLKPPFLRPAQFLVYGVLLGFVVLLLVGGAMDFYNWTLVAALGGVAGIVIFLVLGYLVTNKKLKPPFLKPAQFVWYGVSLSVVILMLVGLLVGGATDFYQWTDKAGWIPHTKVVTVSMVRGSEWIDGEYKPCSSAASLPPREITFLYCGGVLDGEEHDLSVRFWGQNDTQRYRTWICQSTQFLGMASFTCKLQ